jgi:succinate dehydrogenase / fumarate reductase, cytochrome b subunit
MNQLDSVTNQTSENAHSVARTWQTATGHLSRKYLTHGWPYIISWFHRLCGIGLSVYVGIHILTLSALQYPEQFKIRMEVYNGWIFRVMELILAVPVIFHALNGGRLLLFEVFSNRRDDLLIKWVIGLSCGYVIILGLLVAMGDQSVTALGFWVLSSALSSCLVMITLNRLHRSGGGILWKLQRATAAYLLLIVPAHMLFMHLNASVGRDAQIIIARMHHPIIKIVDLTLVLGILFHGGYGLISIGQDYLKPNRLRVYFGVAIFLVMIILSWIGIQLILKI